MLSPRRVLFVLVFLLLIMPSTLLAQDVLPLTQTYTDESITFDYPEDWVVGQVTDEAVGLGSNEEAATTNANEVPREEVFIAFFKNVGNTATQTPTGFLEAFTADTPEEELATDIREVDMGGRAMSFVILVESDRGLQRVVAVIAMDDGRLGGMIATAQLGSMEEYISTAGAIIATMNSSDGTTTIGNTPSMSDVGLSWQVFADDAIEFLYPLEWNTERLSENIVNIRNTEAGFVGDSGQVFMQVVKLELAADEIAFERLVTTLDEQEEENEYGEPTDVTIVDAQGIMAPYVNIEEDWNGALFIFPLPDNSIGMLNIIVPQGEMSQHSDIITTVVESISLPGTLPTGGGSTPLVEMGSFTNRDDTFTMSYPDGWFIQEFDEDISPLILVMTKRDVPADNAELAEGELKVLVFARIEDIVEALEYPGESGTGTAPSTIVSYFASLGTTRGYEQVGTMDVFSVGNRDASLSFATATDHERLVLAIDDGNGDIVTVLAFSALGEMENFRPILIQMLGEMQAQ